MFKKIWYPLVGVITILVGCSYEPAFDVTCETEGARLDGRVCQDGVWVATDGADMSEMSDVPDEADGEGCARETDAQMCARLGLTCEQFTGTDNCGASRTIDCGVCSNSGQTCGGGGTPNVCACSLQQDNEFCDTNGKECDPFTAEDACGDMRTVNCGTCTGVASCSSDNTCTCDVASACAQLGATCGMVDVAGQCSGTDSITCGSCDAPNAECVMNQCACEDGFAGDGTSCVDIDECMMNLDNCDANATCANTSGSFTCTCNQGYTGNGVTCVSAIDLVTAVETVEIDMEDAIDTGTLANPVIVANSVPFMTVRLDGTDAPGNRISVDVSLTADNEVTVERDNTAGEAIARVYVVEFDPAYATVQSGTFAFNNATHSENLATAVDRNESFVVFYFQRDNGSEGRDDLYVAATLNAGGTAIDFEREGTTGNIDGHYWVVSAVNSSFSVQHASTVLNSVAMNITLPQAVDEDRSFVLYSWTSAFNDHDANRTQVNCNLVAANFVSCRRKSVDSSIPVVRAQIVSLTGNELVQRGVQSFAGGTAIRNAPLPTAVGSDAMAFGGALGIAGVAAHETSSGSQTPGGFFTQTIATGGTEVAIERASPRDAQADVVWQVIDW